MDLNLNGWRTVVTGATAGLGRAIAEGFVAEGASVMACGRTPDATTPTGVAAAITLDLTEHGAPERLVEAAPDELGGIDTLVAAAGGAVTGTVESAGDATWDAGLELNLMSIMRLVRSSTPHLRERGGRVVIIGALSAREPRGGHAISNVAKAGVTALAKTASRELAGDGILVNCVAPGRIRSVQLDRAFPDDSARREFSQANIPLGRFGDTQEVAPIALLLGSPRNTYITGQVVGVDGGMAWAV